jgi:glucosylceramidase
VGVKLATGGVVLIAVLALQLGLAAVAGADDSAAQVYLTLPNGQKQLERRPDVHFTRGDKGAATTFDVRPDRALQAIRGFGAAFTDSSTWLLAKLSPAARHAALVRLFDPKRGAGLSVMRVPMGASDFTASGLYSYDDMPSGQTDPSLAHFSIDHDRAYVIPVIREALAINPSIQIVANPWSPPAWMKSNDSMVGVSPTSGPGTLRPDAYAPLARYFVRFIEAYREAGIPVWAVTPQNEPVQPTADYAGMFMTPDQEATFVNGYLAPALRAAGLGTRILGYDYTWLSSEPYVTQLMNGSTPLLPGAAADIDGLAYHCYFGEPESMSTAHSLFPGKEIVEDECSTGISKLSPIQVLIRSVNNWASTVMMWNVALDPAGGPKVGSGCVNCIGVTKIDPKSGAVSYTGNYFQLAHASKFVRRGAVVIGVSASPPAPSCGDSVACGVEAAAFRNPDGSTVLVATNSGPATTFAVRRPDGSSFEYPLADQQPPRNGTDNSEGAAVATFVWGGSAAARPRLALRLRCTSRGVRARVGGRGIARVRSVSFFARGRRAGTDRRRPFARSIRRARFGSTRRWRVRAVARVRGGSAVTLRRAVRRCRA